MNTATDKREDTRKQFQAQLEANGERIELILGRFQGLIAEWMELQGFDNPAPTDIALMHSELSEALEAMRHERWTGKDGVGEELADVVIRVLHFAGKHGINLGQELVRKMTLNLERPFKHGKEF